MPKPNEYVKMLLTNNTIESKHPNSIISQWWNTNWNMRVFIGGCTVNIFSSENHTLSTVCKHLLASNVLQHLTCFSRSVSDSKCTFLCLNTLSCKSLFAIRRTEVRDIPVNFWISLRLLLDPGLPSWLHISSTTRSIFCVVRTVHFRPLPTFREIEFVLSILRRRSLTELTAQFLLGNSLQMCLAPHPFCWQTSLMDALSSYIKCMFINKLLVTMTLHCFPHCVSSRVGLLSFILSHYKLLKNICTKFAHVTQNWLYFNVHYSL